MKYGPCVLSLLILTATAVIAGPDNEAVRHWAYEAPRRPALPEVRDGAWCRNGIDRFVMARLEREGLRPSPRADRAVLLRRVSLDLTGLPPSPEDVRRFLADTRPGAYDRAVDRLLASPRFGERWARPWLDLARYADSNGFQADQLRDSWAYRDWVVRALNRDMPFDRFTMEQIAGDLIPDATPDQRIATGFHRTPTCNVEAGVDPEENRVNQVIDRVNTTATVWLGTTLECAQCHEHKYDPFTQEDYYRLFAYFNNTPLEVELRGGKGVTWDFYGPKMALPLPGGISDRRRGLEAKIRALEDDASDATDPEAWARRMAAALSTHPAWHVLRPSEFASTGDETHEVLGDGSVLVGGSIPGSTSYTVTVKSVPRGVTAFKLETLTHPSLPGTGPGRGDAKRSNFVLNEFEVHAGDRAVSLHGATAGFSQDRWDVAGAIDGNPESGWAIAPKFHQDHWAIFRCREVLEGGGPLTFTLDQTWGRGRTIGRFRISALTGDAEAAELPDGIAKILRKKSMSKGDRREIAKFLKDRDPDAARRKRELDGLKKQLAGVKGPTTLVMKEMDDARTTRILERGEFLSPGEEVSPGTPKRLHEVPAKAAPDRTGLARWLVSRDNPLVARVTVNRWWAELFGTGLVKTLEDFGTRGERPSHPGLLDWLAIEFMDSGWSMKHVLRLIVTSATYAQSSAIPTASAEIPDPENRKLARGPRFRMSAEMLRDQALAVSGLLVERQGGPPVFPPQPPGLWRHVGRNAPKYNVATGPDRFRRGVYTIWRRGAPYASFVTFDAPDRAACVVNRPRTNTPLQALALMNDEAYVEMAMALAGRLLEETPGASVRQRLDHLFRICLVRAPGKREIGILESIHARASDRFSKDAGGARLLVQGVKGWKAPASMDVVELATWFRVATVLLNLHETVTRG